jgi:dolichyl-diphosphooligosaccharide--protein glycosyltransferase
VARALTPIGLFALALAVRLAGWTTLVDPDRGRVVFSGMDAWYHMRRVRMALAHGGWPPAFDPYLNFPHGAAPIWPPLFDAIVTAWVWPFHALGGWHLAEVAAAVLPPLVGAACVVVVYRLGLRLFDPVVAGVAGLGLALLSAHSWYSQIGFVDHHVAVALATTGLLASATRLLEGIALEEAPPWLAAGTTGTLCGLCLLLWPGTLLHVGIVVAALGAAWLARPDPESAARAARALALTGLVGLLLTLPQGISGGSGLTRAFNPTVLSGFQPWLFAILTAVAGLGALAWPRRLTLRARAVAALGLGGALVVLSALLLPGLATGLDEAWRWLLRDEPFQILVRESRPLFVADDGAGTAAAELHLSRLLWLTPLALVAAAIYGRSARGRPAVLLLVGWTLVMAAATLLQRRFFNSLSPAWALVMAWSFVSAYRGLGLRPSLASPAFRRALQLASVAIGLVLFAPTLAAYRAPLANLVRTVRGEPLRLSSGQQSRRAMLVAADWLGTHTPPTAGVLDPTARPEYGVLCHWAYGHLIKYVAQRPTLVGNFGDDVGPENLRLAQDYLRSREPEAVRILESLGARYVVFTSLGDVPEAHLQGEAMQQRLSRDDGPGLRHHRLLWESPRDPRWARIGRSEFRIFERVKGARLVGRSEPGARVSALLEYTSNGRRGLFQVSETADANGRYEIVVPYANRGAPPGVETAAAYQVVSAGVRGDVIVREQDVQMGAEVAGPALELPGAERP